MRWTDDRIESTLKEQMRSLGHYPTSRDLLAAGLSGLSSAISRHPLKHTGWRLRLTGEEKPPPEARLWTDDAIGDALMELAEVYGRMPTCKEMEEARGSKDLVQAITGHELKVDGWAERLGLEQVEYTGRRGKRIEEWVKRELERRGHTAELTHMKCPYDLIVDGCKRVEVKLSRPYENKKHRVRGHLFTFGRRPQRRGIDFAVLVCVDEEDNPTATYVIPERYCRQQTVTITGSKRWVRYLNAWRYIKYDLEEG